MCFICSRYCKVLCLFLFPAYCFSQSVPAYSVTICEPQSTGFYFLTAGKTGLKNSNYPSYHLILDSLGNLVYYRAFPPRVPTGDFKIQPNGLMSFFKLNKFFLIDSTFTVKDSVYWKNNLQYDGHDLQLTRNGHFLLLGIEELPADLSQYKVFRNSAGSASATVRYGVIQEQDQNKQVVFEWHSKAHYNLADMDTMYLNNPDKVDIPHFNSVEADRDGNYIVSCRNFNEITKVSAKDGQVMWRLGGKNNQFRFRNDNNPFKAQHSVRRINNGNLLLYDNGYPKPLHPSSAREYELDEEHLTAKLVWSYINDKKSYSTGIGNVRRLSNSNSLINYGMSKTDNVMCNVVTPAGKKIFELVFTDTLRAYRAFNYDKLPWKIMRPEVVCVKVNGSWYLEAESGHKSYIWFNGDADQRIPLTHKGRYYVSVPLGEGRVCSETVLIDDPANPPKQLIQLRSPGR